MELPAVHRPGDPIDYLLWLNSAMELLAESQRICHGVRSDPGISKNSAARLGKHAADIGVLMSGLLEKIFETSNRKE